MNWLVLLKAVTRAAAGMIFMIFAAFVLANGGYWTIINSSKHPGLLSPLFFLFGVIFILLSLYALYNGLCYAYRCVADAVKK